MSAQAESHKPLFIKVWIGLLALTLVEILRIILPAIEATAIYWHFMDGLWIYLLLLLMLWR